MAKLQFLRYIALPIGAIVTLCVAATFWLYRDQAQIARHNVERSLEVIAQLKADQISSWRYDRLNDAADVMSAVFLYEAIDRWLNLGETEDHNRIVQRLHAVQKHQDWLNVLVADPTGKVRISLGPSGESLHDMAKGAFATAMQEHKPILSEPHIGPGETPAHIDVVAPLIARDGKAIGAVILQSNLEKSFYPLLERWPTRSETAETLLARLDGDDIEYISKLRHRPGSELKLRIPISQTYVPAVKAALRQFGFFDGLDYRNTPVVAVTSPIPDSTWVLVTKLDKAEALAEWNKLSISILLAMAALTVVLSGSAGWFIYSRSVQRELSSREASFRMLFDGAPDAYLIMELHSGLISACNRATERMLRGSREQIIGLTPDQLSPPIQADGRTSLESVPEKINTALDAGYNRFEWIHRRLDGSDFWVEVTISLGTYQQRQVLFVSWREIGEIIAAKQAAEAANVAKSQFLATMSHEIRTPMNGVLGMAQLLLMPNVPEEERLDYARTILNSGQTLLTLLNDILDLSKVEAGKIALESTVYDAGQLLHEIGSLFSENAKHKGLHLEFDPHDLSGKRFLGDPQRLRQMLSNLVSNAIKFTEHGYVRVEAFEIERDAATAVLGFAVSDMGIGIPEDKQQLLYQPFSQLDGSITRRFGGTGLGLSIVRRLAQLMGGDVGVSSEPGEGSCFWFHVKVGIVGAGDESRHADRPTVLHSEAAETQRTSNVLVVEDNATNRAVIRAMLNKQGIDVRLAENGQEAVEAIVKGGQMPDLVLMDIQMPVMDGLEATKSLRNWEAVGARLNLTTCAR